MFKYWIMKKIHVLIWMMSVISLGLTSCLKDDRIDDLEYGIRPEDLSTKKIIEIPADADHMKSIAILAVGAEQEITIGEVRLAAEKPAGEDIEVVLKKSVQGDLIPEGEELFPLDKITLPTSVVIPKGERAVPLTAKIKTEALQANGSYLVIEIESVKQPGYTISGNFGNLLLALKVRSPYEGKYKYEMEGDFAPPASTEVYLETVSPTRLSAGGLFGGKFSNKVYYEIDPTTNKVTLDVYGQATSVISGTYDPNKKSFTIEWNILGGRYVKETYALIQ